MTDVSCSATAARFADVDAVVIGRNEGARLVACLQSLSGQVNRIIYVDSGSTDGSLGAAAALGAEIVSLDMSLPFTAARARNAGLKRLNAGHAGTLIQFLDGDCSLVSDWLPAAVAFLAEHPDVAVVCGRRREDAPDDSIYNHLCDLEWDTPLGEATACGGDALMRRSAVVEVGGYRDSLIAGEEPEMCLRLRRSGWKIWRIDAEMTRHDARMTRFGQWWNRSRRAGHAFAEGAYLHGAAPERHWVAQTRRALVWGGLLPVVALSLFAVAPPAGGLVALAYPAQFLRLSRRDGSKRAWFSILGKFAEALGVCEFHLNRIRGRHRGLIEYK